MFQLSVFLKCQTYYITTYELHIYISHRCKTQGYVNNCEGINTGMHPNHHYLDDEGWTERSNYDSKYNIPCIIAPKEVERCCH